MQDDFLGNELASGSDLSFDPEDGSFSSLFEEGEFSTDSYTALNQIYHQLAFSSQIETYILAILILGMVFAVFKFFIRLISKNITDLL